MDYSNPETALLQEQASNPILGNPLLLVAILLFLAILPRALRHILSQKDKTALDKMVEQFEDDELEASAKEESYENDTSQEKPASPPKDSSLAYLMENTPTSEETPTKVVKEGIPISHNRETDFSLTSKRKIKLIQQGAPIPLGESKEALIKASAESLKNKKVVQGQKPKPTGLPVSEPENEEPDNNWVEAEIPGLIMDNTPAPEKPESIPTFKASPKVKHPTEVKTSSISPQKEKPRPKVKNIASKSEEKKDTKPKKYLKTKMDSLDLEMEISESKPKTVEIKDAIASHKDRDQKATGQKKAMRTSVKIEKSQKTEPEVTAIAPQREDMETSPEKIKPTVTGEELHDDMMDAVLSRLNELQVDLENQLVSIPDELTAIESSINESMRKDRTQSSVPDLEGPINDPSDKKEVSLEELDSFLFTATQRRK